MSSELATQLITAGATLTGVVVTLIANAFVEARRTKAAEDLESLRLTAEHTKWLRDERVRAYGQLSIAGEDGLQFIRVNLPTLINSSNVALRRKLESQWIEIRTELRKAYNQVA
jgi:hypothetical protein